MAPSLDYTAAYEVLLRRFLAEGEGGGGGGETAATAAQNEEKPMNYMVYSPSYYIATVTAILIVISVLFEKLIHVVHRWFGKKKNKSLVHVVDRIKDELMVAGFLAIILALANPLIAGWCVPVARDNILIPCKPPEVQYEPAAAAPEGSPAELGHPAAAAPEGSPAELGHPAEFTRSTTGEVPRGDGARNTAAEADHPKVAAEADHPTAAAEADHPKAAALKGARETLEESSSDESANDWKGRRHNQRLVLESLLPKDAGSFNHPRGRQLAESTDTCPEGKEPFMTPGAIHQLHLFIFFLVVGHIAYTCITISIAHAKVSRWKKWEKKGLKLMGETKTSVSGQLTRALQQQEFIFRRTGRIARGTKIHARDAVDVASSSADDVEQPPASMERQPDIRATAARGGGGEGGGGVVGEVAAEGVVLERAGGASQQQMQIQQQEIPQHFSYLGDDEYDMDRVYEEEERVQKEEEERKRQEEREGGGEGTGRVPKNRLTVTWSEDEKEGEEEGGEAGGEGGGARAGGERMKRSCTMASKEASKLTIWQSLLLTLQCFWQQLVDPITKSDYYTLRLAFIHNQQLPRDFNFFHHVICALEKDFVRIVGLSWYIWFTLVVMMCFTSYVWDVSFIFSILGFIIVLAVGTKLEYIVSVLALESAHVTGDCEGEHLKPRASLFWFKRPSFMLHLLHFAMFVSSYMVGNLITFYFLMMNQEQCKEYSSWQPWLKFIIGIATLLICSLSTLPLYALVIHVGASTSQSAIYSMQPNNTCARCDKDKALAANKSTAHADTEQEAPVSPSSISHMKRIQKHRSKDDVRV